MHRFTPKLLTAACLIGSALMSGSALAATTINLSYNGAPDAEKNAVHMFATTLKTLVEEKTDHELELRLFPNSMLGKEEERMEQTMNEPMLNIASFAGISPLSDELFVSAWPASTRPSHF